LHFRRQRTGSFIAAASMSGHITNIPQSQTAHNAAKAAVTHYVKGLAAEWAVNQLEKITVNRLWEDCLMLAVHLTTIGKSMGG